MRLPKVERGQWPLRVVFPWIARQMGGRVPDVVRTLVYRPKFYGRPNNAWIQAILRGPSPWSVWERELFAAFTSRCNHCPF
jgi:hypothetical protein